MRVVGLIVASLLLLSPAWSEEKSPARTPGCIYGAEISKAADFLLTEPTTNTRFRRNLYATDAAYLKLHYGGMSYAAGLALLNDMLQADQPPARLDELRFAYVNDTDRLTLYDSLPVTEGTRKPIAVLGLAGWRAAIVAGDEDWLLARFAEWRAADPYEFKVEFVPLAQSLLDVDDAVKLRIAQKAEKLGFSGFSVQLLTTLYDLQPLIAVLDRTKPKEIGDQRARIVRSARWNSLSKPLFEIEKQPREIREVKFEPWIQSIFEAIDAAPEAFVLYPLMNYTGDSRLGTVVAESILAGIAAGVVDPVADPDKSMAILIALLDQVFGSDERVQTLMRVTSMGPGRPGQSANEVIDRALARYAMRPLLHDPRQTTALPRPPALSEDFPWPQWSQIALTLREGKSIKAEEKLIAADLLAASGLNGAAIATLASDGSLKARQQAYELMLSLDNRCARWFRYPISTSDPVYRFDRS